MQLFKPVPMIPSAAISNIGGRRYHRLLMAAALSARTYVITHENVHTDPYIWGEGG
jgi:hypothetical protein